METAHWGPRLSGALAACDMRGWERAAVGPKGACRAPIGIVGLGEKARERWIVKNPPEAHSSLIRVWGVLKTYRPPGQTSWFKALVRHGADPRATLAGGLGVSAGDIRVRDTER